MSATNHTQNYDLSQFVGGDIPSWLGDYNGDMGKIDTAIATVASGAGDTASEVNSLKSRMTAAEADIDAAESNIATLQSTTSTQGAAITQNANNITTTNNNVSALDTRVTALENASGSGLDLTAYSGTVTATPSIGTLGSSDVEYHMNSDKTIGKIDGGIIISNATTTSGWNTLVVLTSTDLPTRAADKTISIGFVLATSGNSTGPMGARLVFKTDGSVEVQVNAGSATYSAIYVSLLPCLYLLDEGI